MLRCTGSAVHKAAPPGEECTSEVVALWSKCSTRATAARLPNVNACRGAYRVSWHYCAAGTQHDAQATRCIDCVYLHQRVPKWRTFRSLQVSWKYGNPWLVT